MTNAVEAQPSHAILLSMAPLATAVAEPQSETISSLRRRISDSVMDVALAIAEYAHAL